MIGGSSQSLVSTSPHEASKVEEGDASLLRGARHHWQRSLQYVTLSYLPFYTCDTYRLNQSALYSNSLAPSVITLQITRLCLQPFILCN